jgi:O-antigen/teichoic acid export membrane protein
MAGGASAGQGIVLAATPVVSRLFTPEEFGVLAVYVSIVSVLGVAGALRYELVIPIAPGDRDARTAVYVAFILAFSIGFLLTGVLWLFPWLLEMVGAGALLGFRLMIPAGVLSIAMYAIAMHWALRESNYDAIASTQLAKGGVEGVGQILLGFIPGVGAVGLISGYVAGRAAGFARLLRTFLGSEQQHLNKSPVQAAYLNVRRYWRVPVIATPSALINTAGFAMVPLLLSGLFGTATAGYYAVAYRIVVGPAGVIGKAVSHTFIASVSELLRSGAASGVAVQLRSAVRRLAILGLPPLIALLAVAEPAFALVLGDRWAVAGAYAQILSIAAFFQFIVSPVSQVLHLMQRHGLQLAWDAMRLVAVVVPVAIVYLNGGDALAAILVLSVASAASYGVLLIIVWRVCRP